MDNLERSPFRARISLPDRKFPIRAYIHRAGTRDVFGSEASASEYFMEQLDSYLGENLSGYDFTLAVIWGSVGPSTINSRPKTNYRNIDVFGFSGLKENWSGNPDVSNFVMTNGIFRPLEKPADVTTCGDTLILLGREEGYRRTTPNLDFYMINPPNLGELLKSS